MRYVPGAVLKGAIVDAVGGAEEVDDDTEEDVEAAVGFEAWVEVCCCCGDWVLELELELAVEGICEAAVLREVANPAPNPPPNAAPTTKSTSASMIQNIRLGSPHMGGNSGVWGG